MNQIIGVKRDGDRITVLARELHEFLEIGTKFQDWFKRMCEYGFVEGADFYPLKIEQVHSQKRERTYSNIDYQLTLDMAKEISMLQRNERGKEARRYFIECEKQLQQPKSMEDIMIYQLQEMKRLREESAKATAIALETKGELQGIRDVVVLDTTSWRDETGKLMRKIGIKLDGGSSYQEVQKETYRLLEKRMGVNLNQRLTNKRRRMADEGVCKSKRDRLNFLDIIQEDKKLIEGYVSIVKQMTIRYGVV